MRKKYILPVKLKLFLFYVYSLAKMKLFTGDNVDQF